VTTRNDASELQIATQPAAEGVVQLSIGGTLDWSNYHKVDLEIQRLFGQGIHRIIVNLSGVKLITSAGFGCFIGALDTALKNRGNLIFVRIPPETQEIFKMLGLSRILTFAETEQEALTKFK
jgi:anti-anti-sigma factor